MHYCMRCNLPTEGSHGGFTFRQFLFSVDFTSCTHTYVDTREDCIISCKYNVTHVLHNGLVQN